jgi:hypothetical protein
LAQGEQPDQPLGGDLLAGRRLIGQVTALGDRQFTIQNRQGQQRTVLVGERTRYRSLDWQELSFEDLQTGSWVAVIVQLARGGELRARLVILLPEGYDLTKRLGGGGAGTILAVDPAAGTFELQMRSGGRFTFETNENTVFSGEVQELGDLQVGMQAQAAALRQMDGALLAVFVNARFPLDRHAGRVESVEPEAGTFNLTTRAGERLVVRVDEDTRFRSRGGFVQGLDQLEPGMLAAAAGMEQADGSLLAKVVVIMDRVFRQPLPPPWR